jgi:hypothetical protein
VQHRRTRVERAGARVELKKLRATLWDASQALINDVCKFRQLFRLTTQGFQKLMTKIGPDLCALADGPNATSPYQHVFGVHSSISDDNSVTFQLPVVGLACLFCPNMDGVVYYGSGALKCKTTASPTKLQSS